MASPGVFFRPVEADNGSASVAFTAEIDGKAVSCPVPLEERGALFFPGADHFLARVAQKVGTPCSCRKSLPLVSS